MAALELDKLEVTVYVYHENTCTFGGVYVPCIYTHALSACVHVTSFER